MNKPNDWLEKRQKRINAAFKSFSETYDLKNIDSFQDLIGRKFCFITNDSMLMKNIRPEAGRDMAESLFGEITGVELSFIQDDLFTPEGGDYIDQLEQLEKKDYVYDLVWESGRSGDCDDGIVVKLITTIGYLNQEGDPWQFEKHSNIGIGEDNYDLYGELLIF